MVKILKYLPKSSSLFETVIVSANDCLVELFLNKKIKFIDIQRELFKIINNIEFKKFKKVLMKHGTVEACNRCDWLQLSEKQYS